MRVASKFLCAKNVRGVRQSTLAPSARSFSSQPETFLWPREAEGNIYIDNWSLTEDGVVPTGDMYRNARLPILTSRLSAKVEAGKVVLEKPKYTGAYASLEAGDSIDHDTFSEKIAIQQTHLSSGVDLFVEDAFMGTSASGRVGVRVVTDSAATALIVRTLMIPGPPRPSDHRARFNGWNFDERWIVKMPVWNGTGYDMVEEPTESAKGERPVVLFHGGPGDAVALQFVERKDAIVGANVIVGGSAPIRGMIAALGQASSVLINTMYDDCLAIASVSVTKGKDTRVIIGADDSVVDAAVAKSMLFGAYDNILSVTGVAPMWNGVITAAGKAGPIPSVVVDGMAAVAVEPNNLAFPATSIVFYEAGAKKSTLTEEEAVAKLIELSDESRAAVAAAIVKGVKLTVVGTAADAIAM